MFDTPIDIRWNGDLRNAKTSKITASAVISSEQTVEVYFSPLVFGSDAIAITFLCEKLPTNHAIAIKVFNVVVQAFIQYFETINQPKVIIYSADIPSMFKLYQRLHSIYTTKNIGYKNIIWDELPDDVKGRLHTPDFDNVISIKV